MSKLKLFSKRTLIGAMLLSMTLLLTSCGTLPERPSDDYLKPTPIVYLSAGPVTNSDIIRVAQANQFQVQACNIDKAALEAWFNEQSPVRWWSLDKP